MMRRILFIAIAICAMAGNAFAQFPGYGPTGQLYIGQGSAVPPLWAPIAGDCTLIAAGTITCTKTNGASLGTMATQNASAVAITGGSITGMSNPVNGPDVANKAYVDATASGLVVHPAVRLATAAALPTNTYNNGTAGVGATLTATANAALTVDGTAVATSDRIIVKNEATPANNGIYTVTNTGSAGAAYVLTRATDANTVGTGDPTKIGIGSYALVTAGSTLANTGWTVNTAVTTIGTSAVSWVQFLAASNGVASLNGLIGTLTIGAGTDITVTPSGSTINVGLTNNAITLGSTSMALGSTTSTINGALTFGGAITNSSTTRLNGALTYGGVALSNAVTGTGNMVLSNAPTFSGVPVFGSNISVAGQTQTNSLTVGSSVFFTGIPAGPPGAFLCFNTSNNSAAYSGGSCIPSDARLKANWGSAPGLWSILQIHPGSFDWLDRNRAQEGRQIGLSAQDVEQVIPEIVQTSGATKIELVDGIEKTIDSTKSVRYDALVVPLINAVQTLTIICGVLFLLIVALAQRQWRLSRQMHQRRRRAHA